MTNLFVVAHPDDEILGAGAFIYQSSLAGDESYSLVLNSCDTTRYTEDLTGIRQDLMTANEYIGIKKTYYKDYKDSCFNSADHRQMVIDIETVIREVQPDRVFTQFPADINSDHYWTAQSCFEAFRLWQRGREQIKPISSLYLMEVQSSTDWAINPVDRGFRPNTFVEISPEALKRKEAALDLYENVIRPIPHPRSYQALDSLPILRGAQGGFPYAEAFECVFDRRPL